MAVLSVEHAQAASHQGKGWEQFTDALVQRLSNRREGLIFMLWGSYAQKESSPSCSRPSSPAQGPPSLAAVGPSRFLRLPALFSGQSPAPAAGSGTHTVASPTTNIQLEVIPS